LREPEKNVKKNLALYPEKEEFCGYLSGHAADIWWVGTRSQSIVDEIDDLIDQLPED